jgi:peptidoglycan hydrolase-like protein with peptidoglycan-binding domain
MRYPVILAGSLIAGVLSTLPAGAQTAPPLAYVQPLPQQAVQTVQDRLRQAGSYGGQIDGIWGADSQSSLERFQQAHQLQVTGQLNQATVATLGLDPNMLVAAPAVAAAAVAPPTAPPPDQLLPASVRTIQGRLRSLGFYGGAVDGIWGGSTQTAIERFQQGRGLQPNGQLNPATITAMGLAPEVMAYR